MHRLLAALLLALAIPAGAQQVDTITVTEGGTTATMVINTTLDIPATGTVGDTILFDTFTEGSNTLLTAHTPEVGGAWSKLQAAVYPGDTRVGGGDGWLEANDTDNDHALYGNAATYLTPNYSILVNWQVVTVTQYESQVALYGRASTDVMGPNGYATNLSITDDETAVEISLGYYINGSWTSLGSSVQVPISAATTYAYELRMSGSTIEVWFGGVLRHTATNGAISTPGQAAIRTLNNDTVRNGNSHASDILVTVIAGPDSYIVVTDTLTIWDTVFITDTVTVYDTLVTPPDTIPLDTIFTPGALPDTLAVWGDSFDSCAPLVSTPWGEYGWGSTNQPVINDSATSYSPPCAVRFRYGPDADGADSWEELRFHFGGPLTTDGGLDEVWVEYWIRIPDNFFHRNSTGSDNNKFFKLERRDRRLDLTIEYNVQGTGGDSYKRRFQAHTDGVPTWNTTSYPDSTRANVNNFIDASGNGPWMNAGQWSQVRVYYRPASTCGVFDGNISMWIDGTLVRDVDGDYCVTDGVNVLEGGYLMGWSNSGYTQVTDFYIDDFSVYSAWPGWGPGGP